MTVFPATARALAAGVARGEFSAEEVARETLARIVSASHLNAFVHLNPDLAIQQARDIDARRSRGGDAGRLMGVPVAVKDNLCTAGFPTTCGSRILSGFRAPFRATAVERLVRAGAVVAGKTNCDEFAMGSSNENSCYGPVLNPHDPERVPGGSSGGSACAVAAGLVPLALGSDTGGSVRQPAALCGVVGLKPTYGRVSRWGLVAFGSSLDQVGPLSRDVRDAALALVLMAGADGRDATCPECPPLPAPETLEPAGRGLRVGFLREFSQAEGVDPAVRLAVERAGEILAAEGGVVEETRLPMAEYGIPIYYLIATAEASSNLARFDGVRYGYRSKTFDDLRTLYERTRGEGFGEEVKRRIMLGTFALSAGYQEAFYGRAQRARALLTAQLDQAFEHFDVLLAPTAPTPAFRLGEKTGDPLAMYLSDVFTVPASLGGHPALSLPAPRAPGSLPVGVQLVGPRFGEWTLLRAALTLEERGYRMI